MSLGQMLGIDIARSIDGLLKLRIIPGGSYKLSLFGRAEADCAVWGFPCSFFDSVF